MEVETDLILREVIEGVAVIRMNRKSALNALNPQLFSDLLNALASCDNDPSIHCVLLASESKAFCVGADIKFMSTTKLDNNEVVDYLKKFDAVSEFNKPLIALVNGVAFGGGFELALACDIILASTMATFSFPEIELGLIPGGGGTQRITKAVGRHLALEMILTNKHISGRDAVRLGFVNAVYNPEELFDEGIKISKLIASKRQEAVVSAKKAVKASLEKDTSNGLLYEKELFAELLSHPDGKEGINAFLEKRSPKWNSG